MPTIEFSDAWAQGFGLRMLRVGDPSVPATLDVCGYLPYLSIGAVLPQGLLAIMKGSVPSDFSTLTSYSARDADALVVFNQSDSSTPFSTPAASNPILLRTPSGATASASGTATWFWMLNYNQIAGTNQPIFQQIIGTVGTPGSGADLEILSTTVVSGQTYRIDSLKFQFPKIYTY